MLREIKYFKKINVMRFHNSFDNAIHVEIKKINKQVNIFWFLCGDENVASSRLQGYIIHRYLKSRGYKSTIIYAPPYVYPNINIYKKEIQDLATSMQHGIVVLQKLSGLRTHAFIKELNKRRITSIYIQCDYRPNNKVPLECSKIVCTSTKLAKYYFEQGKQVIYIPDPVENISDIPKLVVKNSEKIKLVWVGDRGHWGSLNMLKEILLLPSMDIFKLVTISNHPNADFKWDRKTVFSLINECDIGVIPIDLNSESANYKSNNRPTMFMACGKPVITGDIKTYSDLLVNGKNGYICKNKTEWIRALKLLKSNKKRYQIASNAYMQISKTFRIIDIGKKWENLFKDIIQIKKDRKNTINNNVHYRIYLLKIKIIMRFAWSLWQNKKKGSAINYSITRFLEMTV